MSIARGAAHDYERTLESIPFVLYKLLHYYLHCIFEAHPFEIAEQQRELSNRGKRVLIGRQVLVKRSLGCLLAVSEFPL